MELYNAHVTIVGGSKGLGAALAYELSSRGARITVMARPSGELEKVAADTGGLAVPVDLTDLNSLEGLVDRVEKDNGPIDMMINIAAIVKSGPVRTMQANDLRDCVFTNFLSHMELGRQLVPRLYERQRGTIAICGSISTEVSMIHLGTYVPAKAALTKYGIDLQRELKLTPIRVPVFILGAIYGTQLSQHGIEDPVVEHINSLTGSMGVLQPDKLAKDITKILASSRKSAVYTFPKAAAPIVQLRMMQQRLSDWYVVRKATEEAARLAQIEEGTARVQAGGH
jgi:2,3-dihydro-2,3-dihydroxybenzoate dehydrogenase